MPQVNEYSWLYTFSKFSLILFSVMLTINFTSPLLFNFFVNKHLIVKKLDLII